MSSKRIISYNVNGIRAAKKKGLFDWITDEEFDVVCIQETKAHPEQVDMSQLEEAGYNPYWFSAEKKGYSGVAIITKDEPKHIEYGCSIPIYDREGRCIRADFDDYSIISMYFPSGTSGEERQDFKMRYLADIQEYLTDLRKSYPNLIVSGDYNICNKAIDIHNPVSNKNSSGFLPEEREWMDEFFNTGFVDSFRAFNQDPHWYSWWSFRFNSRANNKGWRIDYHAVADDLKEKMKHADILMDVVHSDHCPVYLELKN